MSLIKVLEYGFGKDNKEFNLIILIPAESYINSFYIASNKDIHSNNIKVHNIFEGVRDLGNLSSDVVVFGHMFELIGTLYANIPSKAVNIYKLKNDFVWNDNGKHGLQLNKEDLTFITMDLYLKPNSLYEIPTELGEYAKVEILPVYDCISFKLKALKQAKCACGCSINREFIDTILLMKCFDLAIQTLDYNYASKLWEYISNNNITMLNNCSCYDK